MNQVTFILCCETVSCMGWISWGNGCSLPALGVALQQMDWCKGLMLSALRSLIWSLKGDMGFLWEVSLEKCVFLPINMARGQCPLCVIVLHDFFCCRKLWVRALPADSLASKKHITSHNLLWEKCHHWSVFLVNKTIFDCPAAPIVWGFNVFMHLCMHTVCVCVCTHSNLWWEHLSLRDNITRELAMLSYNWASHLTITAP